jgi:hypothetical protein
VRGKQLPRVPREDICPSATHIHSTIIHAIPHTGTSRRNRVLPSGSPSHAETHAVWQNRGQDQPGSLTPSSPKAKRLSTRELSHGWKRPTPSRTWGQYTQGKSSPPCSSHPRPRPAASLLSLHVPQPPTLGEGAVRDVEGTHGDAHEDQELKEPKSIMEEKWTRKLSQGKDTGSQSRPAPEPPLKEQGWGCGWRDFLMG